VPSFSPTIVNNTIPAVVVSATNVSYDEIKKSLGDYVYFVDKVYLFTNNIKQLTGVVKFQHYNVNGNQKIENLTPTVDPYQVQESLFYETKDFDVVLDGQSNFKFSLLPLTSLKVQFFAKRLAKKDALDALYPDNFKTLESAMGKFGFFEDWETKI
jgi:hypothetical protein